MSTLHLLCLQATGAVSSYVSGVFAADAKEDADKAVVNGDEEDADEEAAEPKHADSESPAEWLAPIVLRSLEDLGFSRVVMREA